MYLVINACVTAVKVSNFSGHYLRNRSTLDLGVLGYIGIVQHKEHSPEVLHIPLGTPCIRSNNSTSAYVARILNNRHEYGTKEDTLKLLKICQKGKHTNCWEALYMQTFHQKKVLINEQQIGDTNPLFEIARTLHST